jgi:hypothetical protein
VGAKQGVAVVSHGPNGIEWLGQPKSFRLSSLKTLCGVEDLVRQVWTGAPRDILKTHRVIIAIDAPLGFPVAFTKLLNGVAIPDFEPGGREIDNPLAYRATDRHVFNTFGKKPLSASFDKLGNNATVAMIHVRRWAAQCGLPVLPFDTPAENGSAIIEVYPALAKMKGQQNCYEPLERLLPPHVVAGTDECDAAICALLALAFALSGTSDLLPPLVAPDATVSTEYLRAEGWIYHPPVDWLRRVACRVSATQRSDM